MTPVKIVSGSATVYVGISGSDRISTKRCSPLAFGQRIYKCFLQSGSSSLTRKTYRQCSVHPNKDRLVNISGDVTIDWKCLQTRESIG